MLEEISNVRHFFVLPWLADKLGMYCVMLVGGLWCPMLATIMSMLVCLFLVAYVIAYKVVSRKI